MSDPIAPLRTRFRARTQIERNLLMVLIHADLGADALRRLVHDVAGAAGTFGFAALSRAAIQIDAGYAAGERPDRAALDGLADAMQLVIDGRE